MFVLTNRFSQEGEREGKKAAYRPAATAGDCLLPAHVAEAKRPGQHTGSLASLAPPLLMTVFGLQKISVTAGAGSKETQKTSSLC